MDAIWFLIYALATYRLTHFLVFDPLAAGFRQRLGIVICADYDAAGHVTSEYREVLAGRWSWLAEIINCHYCTSLFVAGLLTGVSIIHLNLGCMAYVPLLLAYSAGATLLETVRMHYPVRGAWWRH